jgi:hypothetical protein
MIKSSPLMTKKTSPLHVHLCKQRHAKSVGGRSRLNPTLDAWCWQGCKLTNVATQSSGQYRGDVVAGAAARAATATGPGTCARAILDSRTSASTSLRNRRIAARRSSGVMLSTSWARANVTCHSVRCKCQPSAHTPMQ